MHGFISNTCPAQQAGQAMYNAINLTIDPFLSQVQLLEARLRVLRATLDLLEFDGGHCKELGSLFETFWGLANQMDEFRYTLYDLPDYARTLVYERERAKIEGDSK